MKVKKLQNIFYLCQQLQHQMITKNEIKKIQSLKQSKYRKEYSLFTVEGNKVVAELINSNLTINNILVTQDWLDKNSNYNFCGNNYDIVTNQQMEQISSLTTPPCILAVSVIPPLSVIPDDAKNEIILLLDGINDPGNLGTIIRTADWFGIRKIVISEDSANPWQPKTVQSAMGSLFRMTIIECNIVEFLKKNDTPVYGALMHGEDIFKKEITDNKGIIIIGSESHGIRQNIISYITCPIHIPRAEESVTESLNASVAAGIIIAEVARKQVK